MTTTASGPAVRASSDESAGDDAGVLPAPAVAIMFLGMLGGIQAVDPTIASTALVEASRGLDMEGGLLALAASISTLMLAATVISAGLLGDRIGWRRMLSGALVVAIVGDLVTAAAPSSTIYLLGRALVGLGLGGVFTASFAYIRITTPSSGIPRALGVYAASGSVVLVLFSYLGGLLASTNWRLAFVLIPAACAVGLVLTRVLLPRTTPATTGPADVPGQVLLALGIIGVLFGLSHLSKGPTDVLCWAPMLTGAVLLAVFVASERRVAHPCFPVEVLRHPVFLGAVCAGFIYNFAQSSTILQFSNLWQYADGLEPVRVSLGILPFLLIGIVAALLTGRLIGRGMSNGTAILLGGSLVAAGGVATLLHSGTYLSLVPSLLLIGFGATMASIPYGGLIVAAASGRMARFYGPITSSRATVGQIAYALGLALSTVLVDSLARGGVVRRLTDAGVPPSRTASALDGLGVYVRTGHDPAGGLGHQALSAARTSYSASFQITMIAVGALCLVIGLAGAQVLRRAGRTQDDRTQDGATPNAASTTAA